ncbi:MAG: helix-turn-helix domain-containing protein [Bacteriovoracaceae bacterium]
MSRTEGKTDGISEKGMVNDSQKLFDNFKYKVWRINEVAQYLGVSPGHVYNLVSQGKIPHTKRGKLLFFIPEKILNWVYEGE